MGADWIKHAPLVADWEIDVTLRSETGKKVIYHGKLRKDGITLCDSLREWFESLRSPEGAKLEFHELTATCSDAKPNALTNTVKFSEFAQNVAEGASAWFGDADDDRPWSWKLKFAAEAMAAVLKVPATRFGLRFMWDIVEESDMAQVEGTPGEDTVLKWLRDTTELYDGVLMPYYVHIVNSKTSPSFFSMAQTLEEYLREHKPKEKEEGKK